MNPYGPTLADRKEIAAELVTKAASGDIQDLKRLSQALYESDCSRALLVVLFQHLNSPADIMLRQRHASSEASLALMRGELCLGLLQRTLDHMVPSLKDPLVRLIIANVDSVCLAMRQCLPAAGETTSLSPRSIQFASPKARAHLRNCEILASAAEIQPSVFSAFLASTEFIDTVIDIWLAEGDNAQFIIDLGTARACAISALVFKCLKGMTGREAFIQRICSRNVVLNFAFGLVKRALIVRDGVNAITVWGALRSLEMLFASCDFLCSSSTAFLAAFRNIGYLKQLSSALDTISRKFDDEDFLEIAQLFVSPVMCLTAMAVHRSVAQNWRDLVAGEYVKTLLRVTSAVPSGDKKSLGHLIDAVESMGPYIIYPTVISQCLEMKPPSPKERELSHQPSTAHIYDALWERINHAGKVYKIARILKAEYDVCDNPSCNRTGSCRGQQCSGCSSVIYCSSKCQKQDWKERHRAECAHAKLENSRRKSTQTLYDHTARAFHARIIDDFYNDYDGAELFGPDSIPIFDFSNLEVMARLHKLADEGWWNRLQDMSFPQTYLKPRLSSLLKGAQTAQPDIRYAEFILPRVGDESDICLTVTMKKVGGQYKTMYTVPRFAYRSGHRGII
ncbi:hypothetical protein DFP72DRAFT_57091 [Ephemerocybe angulata]|uniref:MYND-type domain-containing protein n=1 Tax=Ephemerocybe angulata TaxID=980116 RepID=A0A8H6M9I7_9AGAR|nr:hypothetical protein DFP72DRAFT_57091 [Tulosesus angulatus]